MKEGMCNSSVAGICVYMYMIKRKGRGAETTEQVFYITHLDVEASVLSLALCIILPYII